ncbi:MAG: hypothetical protein JXJ04_16370 [Spirochaetales bacterium]|nr:hypothetical protein [Spirochaetales bacterium]
MDNLAKIIRTSCFFFISIIILFPVFAQEDNIALTHTPARAESNYEKALELYKVGEYESSRELVDTYIREFEEQDLYYQNILRANFYVLKAMLSYVFREENYRKEIESLFNKAVRIYLDLEIGDVAIAPPFLVELFTKVKKEYLAGYSKTTRKNTIGFVTSIIQTEEFGWDNIQPGIHYSFNLMEFLSLNMDIKFPIQGEFWNFWRIKSGVIWYPEFRVEQVVFGLETSYIVSINDWVIQKHSISLCGHGEAISRMGLGIGADVEVFRFDINVNRKTVTIPGKTVKDDLFQLFFANLDLYILYTF